MKIWGFIVLASSLLLIVDANENEQRLLENLLRSYNKNVLPRKLSSSEDASQDPVKVTFGVQFTGIRGFDIANGILSTQVWLRLRWNIPALRWDPAKFDGIKQVKVPSSRIWLPDIFLYNSAKGDGYIMADSNVLALISNDGDVSLILPKSLDSWCELTGLNRGSGTVKCDLKFGSWAYHGFDVDLATGTAKAGEAVGRLAINKTFLQRESTKYSCCPEPYPSILVKMDIRRRF